MSKNEALSLLGKVCAEYRGTLKDHQLLQEALRVVTDSENTEVAANEDVVD